MKDNNNKTKKYKFNQNMVENMVQKLDAKINQSYNFIRHNYMKLSYLGTH